MDQLLPKTENLSLGFFNQLDHLEESIKRIKDTLQFISQHQGYNQFLKTSQVQTLDNLWELTLNIEDQEANFRKEVAHQIPSYPLRFSQVQDVEVAPQYHKLILEEDEYVDQFIKELDEPHDNHNDTYEIDYLNRQLRTVKNNLNAREAYLKGFFKEVEEAKNEFVIQDIGIEEAFSQLDDDYAHIKNGVSYAMRFQEAILPAYQDLQDVFTDCFVLNKPKNVVSGDFYWLEQLGEDRYLIGCFDCTGHGVPGAFMSLLGHDLLNEIIHQQKIYSPEKILQVMHHKVRHFLRQTENNNRDGMDAAICLIDYKKKTLEYAGAHNPLLYIQKGTPFLVKADSCAIGGYEKEGERNFTKHTIPIDQTTYVYLFSDGYHDQIGGSNARRFMASRLYRLLFDIHAKPMHKQQQVLEKIIDHWMKSRSQLDDILVVGIEV